MELAEQEGFSQRCLQYPMTSLSFIVAAGVLSVSKLILDHPWDGGLARPMAGTAWLGLIFFTWIAHVRIRVEGGVLRVRAWPGRATVPLASIVETELVMYAPDRIKCLGPNWRAGLVLHLEDGSSLFLASQEPAELAAALGQRLRLAGRPAGTRTADGGRESVAP